MENDFLMLIWGCPTTTRLYDIVRLHETALFCSYLPTSFILRSTARSVDQGYMKLGDNTFLQLGHIHPLPLFILLWLLESKLILSGRGRSFDNEVGWSKVRKSDHTSSIPTQKSLFIPNHKLNWFFNLRPDSYPNNVYSSRPMKQEIKQGVWLPGRRVTQFGK